MRALPRPGSLFNEKLRIDAVLGRGSMGIVFGATDLTLGRRVALKVIAADVLDTDQRRRFEREARAAASLRSEHVVRIYETGGDPLPFLVMELLEGRNLEQLVAERGPLPVPEAVRYLIEALDAIAEAHRAGFVHRDIKPANLFLDVSRPTPRVKVLDFGIVRTTAPGSLPLTLTGETMGTPLYMPPEQVDARPVDARADVWSLGVTLYELVTGRTPFEGATTIDILTRIVRHPPTPVREHRPDVSPALAALLERCFAKNPADRFANAGELATALRPHGEASYPRFVPPHPSSPRQYVLAPAAPARRRSNVALFLACMFATLLAGVLAVAVPHYLRTASASAKPSPSEEPTPSPAASAAPIIVEPPVPPSAAPPASVPASSRPPPRPRHHVSVKGEHGFSSQQGLDGWIEPLRPRLEGCVRQQILCFGVRYTFTQRTMRLVSEGMGRNGPIPSTCVTEDDEGSRHCFRDVLRSAMPRAPLVCSADIPECAASLVVYEEP